MNENSLQILNNPDATATQKKEALLKTGDPAEKKSKYSLVKKKYKMCEEEAIPQMMLLLERYDIDVDELDDEPGDDGSQSKKEVMEGAIDKIVNCIRKTQIEVFEEGGEVKVKLILQNTTEETTIKELVFGELKGKDHVAMPKNGSEFKRMFSLLGSMCETNGGKLVVENLRSSDATAAEYLSLLFL